MFLNCQSMLPPSLKSHLKQSRFSVYLYVKWMFLFHTVSTWVVLNALRSHLILIIWNDKYCMGFMLVLLRLNQKWAIYQQKKGIKDHKNIWNCS